MKIFNYEIPRKDMIIVGIITVLIICSNIFCLVYKISSVDFIEMLPYLLNPLLAWALFPADILYGVEEAALFQIVIPLLLTPLTFIYYLSIYSIIKHFVNKARTATQPEKKVECIIILFGIVSLIIGLAFGSIIFLIGIAMSIGNS